MNYLRDEGDEIVCMSYGWGLAGIIASPLVGGFFVEGYRVRRLNEWVRRNGFARLDNMSGETSAQLNLFVKKFGNYFVSKWGFSLAGMASDMAITIAEHNLSLDTRKSNWYTLVSLICPKSDLLEFRLESKDQIIRDFSTPIEVLFYPLKYLSQQYDWKWHDENLQPVNFSEDDEFDGLYRVYGDIIAAKSALAPVVRQALVHHRWKGQLVASGNAILWRRKGVLCPSRLDRLLAEADILQEITVSRN